MSKTSPNPLPAPPVSLETCWDKAKWHRDAEDFPRHLPPAAARKHILAALCFLDGKGMLTAEGRRELADDLGEDTALLDEHVRAPARAFLDRAYADYLEQAEYGAAPPVQLLESAWGHYAARYDLSKRPKPDPYQALLIAHAFDRKLDTLLRRSRETPEILEILQKALDFVPSEDQALARAVLVAVGSADLPAEAATNASPAPLLRALRYLDSRTRALEILKAACVLARRLEVLKEGSGDLSALGWAVNLASDPEGLARIAKALAALAPEDRNLLAHAMNHLYEAGPDRYLAICAMRSVGDARSLEILRAHRHGSEEGTTQVGNGPVKPGWLDGKNAAIAAIEGRMRS